MIEVQTHLMISLCNVHGTFQFENPKYVKKLVKYRKIKDIDVTTFIDDISNSALSKPDDFKDVATAVSAYDNVLSELLNKHAPMQEHVFTIRKDAPWFTSEIGDAKCAREKC